MRLPPCATTVLFFGVLSTGVALCGEEDSTRSALCSLTLRTGSDTAWVFIDSVRAGTTPITIDSLKGGRHAIRLLQTDLSSWLSGRIDDTLTLAPGESRTLRYTFDRRVMVVTDPSGAVVYMGDSIAGVTPCVLVSSFSGLPPSVTVQRRGYEKVVLQLPTGSSGIARAELQKIWQSEGLESPLMTESGRSDRTGLRLYVAGGVTVAAGIATAYFKIRADERNALFQETGDPALQRETHQLDTSAAISLLVTQVAFAFFTYYLLSD
jgi:hypothetical protein